MFQRAQRKKARLRLALCGPSGSGKTYSSLLMAMGLGGRIALIDTERGSGELYAHLCEYDVCQLTPPFTPDSYVQAIREAEKAKYDTIIVDSLSHAWAGQGGLLEEVDKRKGRGNDFTAWREITPQHNALVDALLQSSAHIIATMRTKTAYDMVKDEKSGKVKPVKVGMAPVQRDGVEYEFTVVMEVDIDRHQVTASKDRTGLFDGKVFTVTEDTGRELKAWLESGVDPAAARLEAMRASIAGCADGQALKEVWTANSRTWEAAGLLDQATAMVQAKQAEFAAKSGKAGNPGKEPGGESGEEPGDHPRPDALTDAQRKAIMAHYKGKDRAARLADLSGFFGRDIASTNDLTKDEASSFLEAVNRPPHGEEEAA